MIDKLKITKKIQYTATETVARREENFYFDLDKLEQLNSLYILL